MADKTLTADIVVSTKGARKSQQELQANREELQKTSAAQTKAAGAQDAYNKRDKAIYQGNLASAKSFSKLSQTIGAGSSGLVGAYATLAANVFAATAAFNALRSAAQIDQLSKSLEFLGNAAGRNLTIVSDKLQEITGYGISASQSMQAASFGFSAGFSTEQLVQLAKVAKGASSALNRDLSDSYDRLIRGVAKLEPEILDELGIIVKLDKATRDYAVSIGKPVDALTAYERQQAFANATITQGIEKYGALSDSLDTNPYDKLSASISNFAVQISKLVMVINPAIESMSQSFTSLIGITTLFASGFARQLLPSLYEIPRAMATFSESVLLNSAAMADNLGQNLKTSDAYKQTINSIREGNYATEVFTEGQRQLSQSINGVQGAIGRLTGIKDIATDTEAAAKKVEGYNNKISDLTAKQQKVEARLNATKTALANYKANVSEAEKGTDAYNRKIETANSRISALSEQKKKLGNSIRGVKGALTSFNNGLADVEAGAAATNAKLAAQEATLKGLQAEQAKLTALQAAAASQQAKNNLATGLATMANDNYIAGLRTTTLATRELIAAQIAATAGSGGFARALAVLRGGVTALASAFAILGTTILRFLPYIGIFLAFGPPLIDWFKNKFMPETEAEKKLKTLQKIRSNIESFYTQLDKTSAQFEVSFPEAGIDRTIAAITALQGSLNELRDLSISTFEEYKKIFEDVNRATRQQEVQVLQTEIDRLEKGLASPRSLMPARGATKLQIINDEDEANAIKKLTALRVRLREIEREISQAATTSAIEETKKQIGAARDEIVNKLISAPQFIEVTAALGEEDTKKRLNAEFDNILKSLAAEGKLTKTDVEKGLLGYLNQLMTGISSAEAAGAAFDKAAASFREKETTQYTSAIKALQDLNKEYLAFDKNDPRKKIFEQKNAEQLTNLPLLPGLLEANNNLLTLSSTVEEYTEKAKAARDIGTVDSIREAQQFEAQANAAKLQALDSEIAINKLLQADITKINALQTQRNTLANQEGLDLRNNLEIVEAETQTRQKLLDQELKIAASRKSILDSTVAIAEAQARIAALQDLGRKDTQLTAAEELDLFRRFRDERLKLLDEELRLKIIQIDLEYGLIEARTKQFLLQKDITAQERKDLETLLTTVGEGRTLARTAAEKGTEAQKVGISEEEARLTRSVIDQGRETRATATVPVEGVIDVSKIGSDIDTIFNKVIAARQELGLSDSIFGNLQAGVAAAQTTLQPFINQLSQLGPDGQLAAAVAQGALSITDSITTIVDSFKSFSAEGGMNFQSMADGISAVSSIIGAIGQMQQASSQQSVAAIDKEIEAEKKRDGKSKESLARIAALEKKKEQEKRKAFDQNKKMLMAQTVMNTAAAIMSVWAGPGDPFTKIAFTALVAALGAAQLATISSMSYQGGGAGGASASVPASVERGERSNKVDVSQRPTGGELAYIQGARGMGTNANNFTPAFMGAKYRATGGYVVGEQGPELFLPDVPGTIVPSDETRQMSAPVNVTFSVSAIDASSFNDMLADQRGNIISLIREAANLSGEPFLESVNTIPMSPTQRTYYRKA